MAEPGKRDVPGDTHVIYRITSVAADQILEELKDLQKRSDIRFPLDVMAPGLEPAPAVIFYTQEELLYYIEGFHHAFKLMSGDRE